MCYQLRIWSRRQSNAVMQQLTTHQHISPELHTEQQCRQHTRGITVWTKLHCLQAQFDCKAYITNFYKEFHKESKLIVITGGLPQHSIEIWSRCTASLQHTQRTNDATNSIVHWQFKLLKVKVATLWGLWRGLPPQKFFWFFCLGMVHFACILTHD